MSVNPFLEELLATTGQLSAVGKGILALDWDADEFASMLLTPAGLTNSEEMRRGVRQVVLTTEGIGGSEGPLSGVLLNDEGLSESTTGGPSFVDVLTEAGVLVGYRMYTSIETLITGSPELVAVGISGMMARLTAAYTAGAKFGVWRVPMWPGDASTGTRFPTALCVNQALDTVLMAAVSECARPARRPADVSAWRLRSICHRRGRGNARSSGVRPSPQ